MEKTLYGHPDLRDVAVHAVPSELGEDDVKITVVLQDGAKLTEERSRDTGTDTARFLAAGARRSLWVRTKQGELLTALPAFRKKIETDQFVIVESNSLRRFINPAVYLQVFDPSISDFKPSAQQYFDLSDAYILVNKDDQRLALSNTGLLALMRKNQACFAVKEENRFINEKVIEFVLSKLQVREANLIC
jgi:hypothetical protein